MQPAVKRREERQHACRCATPSKPAIMPISMVSGVPATITANRSRPCRSLPNGSSRDGGCTAMTESGLMCSMSTKKRPTIVNTARLSSSSRPTIIAGFRFR